MNKWLTLNLAKSLVDKEFYLIGEGTVWENLIGKKVKSTVRIKNGCYQIKYLERVKDGCSMFASDVEYFFKRNISNNNDSYNIKVELPKRTNI